MDVDKLNCGLAIATVAVIIGVFLEGHEHVDDIRKKGWRPVTPKLGFALLVIGLAAELLFQTLIGQADTQFRVDATNRVAEANSRAVRARRVAEQERFDRLQAEKKLAPRIISSEQQEKLLSLLKGGPTGPVLVIPRQDVDEPLKFAAQIQDVLKKAGFEIKPPLDERRRPYSWASLGAFIVVADVSRAPAHAASIQKSFGEVGINLPIYANVTVLPDVETVVIGVNTPF